MKHSKNDIKMQELENYRKEKLTIDLVWANVFGVLILIPIGLLFGLPFYFIWKPPVHRCVFPDGYNVWRSLQTTSKLKTKLRFV